MKMKKIYKVQKNKRRYNRIIYMNKLQNNQNQEFKSSLNNNYCQKNTKVQLDPKYKIIGNI